MNRLARSLSSLPRLASLRHFSLSVPRPSPAPIESELTHPALVKDPPAVTPVDPWSLAKPPAPPIPTGPQPTMQELLASPHPEARDAESTETLRKRLVYESRKRGILEMDLILGTFAKTRLASMDDRQLREYDRVRFCALRLWGSDDGGALTLGPGGLLVSGSSSPCRTGPFTIM